MAVELGQGLGATREASAVAPNASLLSPQVAELARSIGFPPELGDPTQLFVRRDGGIANNTLTAHVRSGGFEADSTMGKAIIDAARVMNAGRKASDRSPAIVFDVSRLDGQPIEVRARAWSALRRMTDIIAPPPPAPAPRAPEGPAPAGTPVPANRRPELAAPRQGAAAGASLPDHSQIRGTSVDFREAFARPENQRLVFDMLLERQPKSLKEGLDAIEARYPGARSNLQQVLSGVQFGLTPFGYTGNQEGMPNPEMARSLAFAREQVRPHLEGAHTRTVAQARAKEMNLQGYPDLLAAIDGATLGWRVMDVVAGRRDGAGS